MDFGSSGKRPPAPPSSHPTRRRRRNATVLPTKFDPEIYAASIRRRLDSFEDDSYAVREASLLHDSDDEEYIPGVVVEDEDGDVEMSGNGSTSSRKRKGRRKGTRGRAAKRNKGGKGDGGTKGKKGLERFNMSTLIALEMDARVEQPEWLPRLNDIEAKASSRRPKRNFCSVCGFEAPYCCARCGMRFCSLKCGTLHDDTRCMKFTI